MRVTILSTLAVLLAAGSATAYTNKIYAREAYLQARDAYAEAEEDLIYARAALAEHDDSFGLYARDFDDSFDIYAREALPYDPSKPAGRNNRPAFASGTFAADAAARKGKMPSRVEEQGAHLPEKYKPHRPGTPNPNTGSFFSGADTSAVHRGSGSRYRRSIDLEE